MNFELEPVLLTPVFYRVKDSPKRKIPRRPHSNNTLHPSVSYNCTPTKQRHHASTRVTTEKPVTTIKNDIIFNAYKDLLPAKVTQITFPCEESVPERKIPAPFLYGRSADHPQKLLKPAPPQCYLRPSFGLDSYFKRFLEVDHTGSASETELKVVTSVNQLRRKCHPVGNQSDKPRKNIIEFQEFVMRFNNKASVEGRSVAEFYPTKPKEPKSNGLKPKGQKLQRSLFAKKINDELPEKIEITNFVSKTQDWISDAYDSKLEKAPQIERSICDEAGKSRKRIIVLQKFATPLNKSFDS